MVAWTASPRVSAGAAASGAVAAVDANPGDRPVAPERMRGQIVAQEKIDSALPQSPRPGLGAEVGIVDRTDGEQLEGLVGLAGVAIEVDEPRLDDGGADVVAFGVGEQRDGPAGASLERANDACSTGPACRSISRSASLSSSSFICWLSSSSCCLDLIAHFGRKVFGLARVEHS